MANLKPTAIVEIPDDNEDDDDDVEFLAQLEVAEAQALSLSSSSSSSFKRRRVTLTSSSPAAIVSGDVKVKLERDRVELRNEEVEEEGAYTAALRGSKSLTWQKQSQSQISNGSASATRSGGGACFKCGKEGHWARDCDQSSSAAVVVGPGTPSTAGVEKSCPCGMGNCFVLTANTERNRGRKFFRCPIRQENGGCGFFEWCDESPGNRTSAGGRAWKNEDQQQYYQRPANQGITKSRNEYDQGTSSLNTNYGAVQKSQTADNKGYNVKTSSSCFKCGGEGHWARDCSMSSSNVTPGVSGKSSSNTCYKCGQSGHWAKDCSQG